MDNLSEKELLNYAIQNGIIDLNTIQIEIEMNERKKYIEKHENEIWQASDGKWHTYLPDETKTNGRRRIKRSTKESLEDALVDFYKKSEHEITMKELFYLWTGKKLEYGEMQRQTFDRYERDFERFFKDSNLKNKKVKYISEEDLEDFIRKTIVKMSLSAKAWSNLRTLLNGMFRFAKKKGYSKINISNFMSELDLSKRSFTINRKDDSKNVFTESEIKSIICHIQQNPSLNGYGVLIAIYTGMRVGEIVALKHEDIFQDYIYVHRTQIRYSKDGKDVHEIRDNPKTEAGVRKVAISKELRKILNKLKIENLDNEYLFYDKKMCQVKTIHALTSYLYRVCKKLNIQKRSMHVLRKTYATRLINSGIDEAIIINQLGHTEIDTTKQYYYYNDKSIKQIAEKIEFVMNF